MSSTVRGWHIAFLILTVALVSVPVSRWLLAVIDAAGPYAALADRMFVVGAGALVLAIVPPIRRQALQMIRVRIDPAMYPEAIAACAFKAVLVMAYAGGIALSAFLSMGSESVVRVMSGYRTPQDELAVALSGAGIVGSVVIASVVAPIVEEVFFRGFLQGAWERRWGWFSAVLLTSFVFATVHTHPFSAFASSVLFSCIYRRTGSLRSAIACHMVGNLLLWYPLMGQFVFPSRDSALGDPATWWFQLACLLIAAIALPLYVILAAMRPAGELPPTRLLQQPA